MGAMVSIKSLPVGYVAERCTDDTLVIAAQSGDEEAFVELWDRHSAKVFCTARRILRNQEDAEDSAQEVFIKAFVHLKGFNRRAQFSTWLTRIAINTALMTLRKKRAHPTQPLEGFGDIDVERTFNIPDMTTDIERQYEARESKERLADSILHLTPTLREIVGIQLRHDCNNKELAALANISVAAMKSRLMRARRTLRRFHAQSPIDLDVL